MAPTSMKPKHAFKQFQKPSKKSFKPKSRSDNVVKSQAVAMQLEDAAPDFPRGGRSSLSREELNEIRAEVDAEFEAEGRGLKKKRRIRKQNYSEDGDLGSLFGGVISSKLPRFANRITWKNISAGMKLWGVISEINEKDIVISLPGGLRGLVRGSEAFDSFSDNGMKVDVHSNSLSSIYYVGQLVACIVLRLDDDKKEKGKPKIWISLRLSLLHKCLSLDVIQEGMVLTAYVKSIEDHGYILHFGLPSFSGFMPINSQDESTAIIITPGHLLEGVVKSIDKTCKVVYFSDPDMVSKSVTRDLKGISIDLLIPGMMVNARVQSTLENGIMLSFLTYFTGTVDMYHLQTTFPNSKWKDDYNQNKKVDARILFIDPSTRAIGLTLNPYLVHRRAPPFLVKTGAIFDHSKVIRVDRGFGLLLEIPSAPFPTPAYVSVSDASDSEVRKLEKNFKAGSHVRVRIHGFKHLEGLATGVLKTSAFEGSVFTHSDVKPGMLVKAKVIVVDIFGAIVQLAGGVKALCPLRHMSEFDISKPRKKFQVGAELHFRVLGCKSKRITVTHKKTLVKSKLRIISSYTDATEGLITHGWITKIKNHGCFVRFYSGVQGFASRSELGLEPGSDPVSVYHVEEVVKCRVTNSLPASRCINLSFVVTPARYFVRGYTWVSDGGAVGGNDILHNQLNMLLGSCSSGIPNLKVDSENGEHPILDDIEARASIVPLEVSLDDMENSAMDDVLSCNKEHVDSVDTGDEKCKRRAKKKANKEREREIRAAEERLVEKDIPRSADEFEKMVRSSPNSSFVWIKYMAFMLSLADVENARSIAERALKTINIREESEKLNIWVAYFNLENEYGNPPEESVQKIFNRALQYSDPKRVHLSLLGMYERTQQHKLSDELLNKMLRKFKHSCKVWLRRIQWLLKQQNNSEIQSVVKRAVICLPRHKTMKFLSQTALFEFKCGGGVPDRGRSMFEGMLREYPKRTDLWSIYLDQEIRLGDADIIHALFERAISLALPPKKMKFLFKKYLEYENSVGVEERIESVKRKAIEYVETTLS